MKNIVTLSFISLLAFAAAAEAKQVEVEMKSISYAPKVLELSPGDTVVWKNVAYTEHSALGETFDTGPIEPKGHSKPIAFPKAGTFTYHCKVHGTTMSGTIHVGAK